VLILTISKGLDPPVPENACNYTFLKENFEVLLTYPSFPSGNCDGMEPDYQTPYIFVDIPLIPVRELRLMK